MIVVRKIIPVGYGIESLLFHLTFAIYIASDSLAGYNSTQPEPYHRAVTMLRPVMAQLVSFLGIA